MRRLIPPLAAAVLLAVLAGGGALTELEWSDYEREALPAVTSLTAGDVEDFLARAPAYGGSLLLRAPFALAADAAGGGPVAVWRALAAPALLAAVALALALWSGLIRAGRPLAAWTALILALLHPAVSQALAFGHPEEVVGAGLCVAAVGLALAGRPIPAGVVLGLAGANKPWAVVAAVPVLLALPRGHARCVLAAGAACGAVLAPFLLTGSGAVASARAVAIAPPEIFKPMQLSWFLGDPATGVPGASAGLRRAPEWIGRLSHPAVVLAGFAVALAWLPRRIRVGAGDAMLLLALVLLTRCLLDVWTISYYFAPFAFALLAWEAGAKSRLPWGSCAAALGIRLADAQSGLDAQAAITLVWALPAWGLMALHLWAPARSARLWAAAAEATRRRAPTLAGLLARPTA